VQVQDAVEVTPLIVAIVRDLLQLLLDPEQMRVTTYWHALAVLLRAVVALCRGSASVGVADLATTSEGADRPHAHDAVRIRKSPGRAAEQHDD
jgi:hypothetical protein